MSSPDLWYRRPVILTVGFPGETVTSHLEHPFARLGSYPLCEGRLGPGFPSITAYLHATDAGVFCFDLRNSDIPDRVTGWMNSQECMRLGAYSILAERDDVHQAPFLPLANLTTRQSVSRPWPLLTLRSREKCQQKILRRGLVLVGRGPMCGIRLDDQKISNRHCILYTCGRRLWVVDLFSSNGTHVNGQQVDVAEVPLGETIQMGGAKIEFTEMVHKGPDQPEAIPASLQAVADPFQKSTTMVSAVRMTTASVLDHGNKSPEGMTNVGEQTLIDLQKDQSPQQHARKPRLDLTTPFIPAPAPGDPRKKRPNIVQPTQKIDHTLASALGDAARKGPNGTSFHDVRSVGLMCSLRDVNRSRGRKFLQRSLMAMLWAIALFCVGGVALVTLEMAGYLHQ